MGALFGSSGRCRSRVGRSAIVLPSFDVGCGGGEALRLRFVKLRDSRGDELCRSWVWSWTGSSAACKTLEMRRSSIRHFWPHAMAMEKWNSALHPMQTTVVLLSQCMNAGCRCLDYMCNERPLWIVTEVPRHWPGSWLIGFQVPGFCPKFRPQSFFDMAWPQWPGMR